MVDVVTFLSSLPSRAFSIFFRKEREAPAEFVTLYRLVGASEQVAILLARQKKQAVAYVCKKMNKYRYAKLTTA